MNLAAQLLEQITDPALARDERALLRVRLSKVLEESGNYEGAREAMSELWSRVGERPMLDGLCQATAAEVLLQVGVLTSCIGSAKQIEGAQEIAKDLISESITAFEASNQTQKVAEAQTALALCYWRQGALDEARVVLKDALSRLFDGDSKQKAVVLLRSAIVEASAARFNDSLRILSEAACLFEKIDSHALRGKFHAEYGTVLKNLGAAESREDYVDRALVELSAASYHFEQAGHTRYLAGVENNLGFLFYTVGRFAEAHEHLDRARRLFIGLKDSVHTAQVDDTRARVLLAEGRNEEAEKVARAAVQTLEKGDERSLLAEALTTHGTALARTGRHARARLALQRAVDVAEQAGDVESAGQAALTVIEELSEHSTPAQMSAVYERAFAPLPRASYYLWNGNALDAGHPIVAVFSVIILAATVVALLVARRRAALLAYLAGTGAILLFVHTKFYGSVRHHGHIYLLFVACLWLAARISEDAPLLPRRLNERAARIISRYGSRLATLFLASHVVIAAYFCVADWRFPFSRSRDAAEFLRASGLDGYYVVADLDAQVSPLTAYLHRKFYYQRADREGTFIVWDKAWRSWPEQNLLETAKRKANERGEDVLVVSNYSLTPDDSTVPVKELTGSIVGDEDYYIYIVKPAAP